MSYSYVVSCQKSTAIHHAVKCHFLNNNENEPNIIVAKNNKIEVYSVVSDSLVLKIKTTLYGNVTSMHSYRPQSSETDVLFVLTERKYFCVLKYDTVKEVLITVAKGNMKDRVGRDIETGQRAFLDPELRMIGMLLYDGVLKVFPMAPNGNFQEAFNIPLEEPRVIDIAFLHRQPKPTFCMLYEDNKMGRHIKTFTVDTREKTCGKGPWMHDHVEFSARILIPVNDSDGGVIVVGQSTITYINNNEDTYSIGMNHRFITAYCALDLTGERFLIGDKDGVLSVLILMRSGNNVNGIVMDNLGQTSIPERICHLQNGLIFIGSVFGDSQLVKLATYSDSSGAQSQNAGDQDQVEVLETYDNIGPIIDMCVVPSERHNQSQVVTCSGGYKDGSLRIIKSGIGIREQAGIEMEGIKKIWSLQQPCSDDAHMHDSEAFDKYLVQAYAWETRVLWIDEDDEMGECEIPGFDTQTTTIFCGNMINRTSATIENFFVQVTPQAVRLVCATSGHLIQELPFGKKIMVADGNYNQIVLALSGGDLIYLEICESGVDLSKATRLVQVGTVELDQDIACMSIRPEVCLEDKVKKNSCVSQEDIDLMDVSSVAENPIENKSILHPTGKSSLLVVGFWTDNSVRLYALPNLVELVRVSLDVNVQVRAVMLASLSGKRISEVEHADASAAREEDNSSSSHNVHLLVGLGDGRVFTYLLDVNENNSTDDTTGLPRLSDRQEIQLGSRPISFSLFVHENSLCVFASCDRPTVIFSRSRYNAKLLFTAVNISDDVTHMTPFNSQCFPNCLAMSSEVGLQIGTIDSLQTIHVQSYHLNESPRHICFHADTATYVVCSTKTEKTSRGDCIQDRVLFFDNKEVVNRCVFDLDPNETAMTCVSVRFENDVRGTSSTEPPDPVEYVVVGTAYVLPEEPQPSRGRILVFSVNIPTPASSSELGSDGQEDVSHLEQREVILIAECVTTGGVFSLDSIQGKLVAGVDSKVLIYEFFPEGKEKNGAPELSVLCEHPGHVMCLMCKASGDLVLVGDILRSMSVFQLTSVTSASGTKITTLREVSRDFNSNYMRAVEILSEEYFMGSEDNGNIFIVRRPGLGLEGAARAGGVTLTEEEKNRLEMQSAFHMGDFANVFRRGMLGSSNNVAPNIVSDNEGVSAGTFTASITPCALFGTVAGCLGAVFILSEEMYKFLDVLEKSMNQVIRGLGGLSHEEFRQFAHERRQGHKRRTVDGDLVEMFLDLPEEHMRQVTKQVNDEMHHLANVAASEAEKGKKAAGTDDKKVPVRTFTLDEVILRVEELVRLH